MNELRLLLADFESSQVPQWYDPKTLEALRKVVDAILKGDYDQEDFEKFATENFGEGDYQKGCVDFVNHVLMYFDK